MADYDAIVIGAGMGGLTTGALLSARGRKVLVLEQASRVGGCCSTFEREGYHFDVGASIVEVLYPIELAFKQLGTTLQNEIDLIPVDPIMSFIYRDGHRVTYPLSVERTGEVISRISPEDGANWRAFARDFSEVTREILETFFTNPASTFCDLAAMVRKNPRIVKFLPLFLRSYQSVLQEYFKHPDVQRTMAYQSLYFGLPPEIVPGIFALVPYSEHEGIYYPRGGMIQIPLAMQRCGERFGMQVRLNQRVGRVMVRGSRVEGVQLADGTQITANLVVSDINAKTLYLDLIGEDRLPWLARTGIKSYKYSKAVPMVYVGLDYRPPLDAHHSVLAVSMEEVNDYWWKNAQRGILPQEPFGLICWSTCSDPSLAPAGHHALNLIPEGFYRLNGKNWDDEKEAFIDRTVNYLDKFAIPGVASHIQVLDCATPLDFERHLCLPEGAIYALQQDLPAQAMFRPSAKSKSIQGLYLAGSSTHPGGGVPSVIGSGVIAAKLIEQNEG
jgi:phytoene desaturase